MQRRRESVTRQDFPPRYTPMPHTPGFGDSSTWGAVADRRDPRYDDSAELAESEYIIDALKGVQKHIDVADSAARGVRLAEAHAAIEQAVGELQELVP